MDFWAVVATHSSEDLGVSRVSHRVNRRVASGGGVEPKDRVSARKSQVQIINVREKLRREKAWFGIPAICFPLPETCKIMPHRKAEIAGSPAELRTLEFEAPGYGKVEIAEQVLPLFIGFIRRTVRKRRKCSVSLAKPSI
ncbi:MAG: hypothetical protein A2X84_13675 [Desulfuromonadaceae bacterium GWC2_58_13]|nr:MAG: hypothetical protein A2X84_13675 [Desulfuromonadaceae bacterium GWC2_58_13]